jgi:hypothetical protein
MNHLSSEEYIAQKNEARRLRRNKYMREEYRKRKKHITCVFEPEQYHTLEHYAGQHGMKPTSFLREAALAYVQRHRLVPKEVTDQLPSLISLIRNIANNINQIARRTNTFKQATFYDLAKARRKVLDLETAITNFINSSSNDH